MSLTRIEMCRFKASHARRYRDDTEEAVRKNLMVQHSRFVNSGNRQGATFNMQVRTHSRAAGGGEARGRASGVMRGVCRR